MTNLTGEGMDLYVNDGHGTFVNGGAAAGIGHRSLPYTGFGVGWLDVDNDGRLDLLAVNGAVRYRTCGLSIHQRRPAQPRTASVALS